MIPGAIELTSLCHGFGIRDIIRPDIQRPIATHSRAALRWRRDWGLVYMKECKYLAKTWDVTKPLECTIRSLRQRVVPTKGRRLVMYSARFRQLCEENNSLVRDAGELRFNKGSTGVANEAAREAIRAAWRWIVGEGSWGREAPVSWIVGCRQVTDHSRKSAAKSALFRWALVLLL